MKNIRLPDFIIGGAPRSGTTFLCHLLNQVHSIKMASPLIPEPKVFTVPLGPDELCYATRYEKYFSLDQDRKKICGEKSTLYLEDSSAAEKIFQEIPEVKLVFLLREPVDRAYSNYLWSRRNGLENLDFEEALRLRNNRPFPLPKEKFYARPFDYLERGTYSTHLKRFLRLFKKEKIKILLYEDLKKDPIGVLASLLDFLGAYEDLSKIEIKKEFHNSSQHEVNLGLELKQQTRDELKNFYKREIEELKGLTKLDLLAWG